MTTSTTTLKPVKILFTNDISYYKRREYFLIIIDSQFKDKFEISIPAKQWRGRYTDFTIKQWEEITGQSFY